MQVTSHAFKYTRRKYNIYNWFKVKISWTFSSTLIMSSHLYLAKVITAFQIYLWAWIWFYFVHSLSSTANIYLNTSFEHYLEKYRRKVFNVLARKIGNHTWTGTLVQLLHNPRLEAALHLICPFASSNIGALKQ